MFTHTDLNKTLLPHPDMLPKSIQWRKVDASQHSLGRLAAIIARHLIGKHKAFYCDQRDCGDFVVVTNAKNVQVTGKKLLQKMYYRYSGYKGNLKSMTLREMLEKKPEDVLYYAVRGMLPKNKLRDHRVEKKLKIFLGESTKFDHYNPKPLPVE